MNISHLSVIVPVFNNHNTVVALHERIVTTLGDEKPWELIFVDDRSSDDSLRTLELLSHQNSRIRVVALSRNIGQNGAVRAGLSHACGDWFVVLDADLQDQPEAIPRLAAKAESTIAVVFAIRTGKYQSSGRMLTSRIYKRLLRILVGLPGNAGLFVLFDRRVRDAVLASSSPSVVTAICLSGFEMASVAVERAERSGDVSSAYRGGMRVSLALRALGWIIKDKIGLLRSEPPLREFPVARLIGFDGDAVSS